MFGYVKTDYPNLYVKDTVLYRSMYCGLCKGIGKSCGLSAKFVLNYDLTFLSILLHNVLGIDVKITKQKCVAHWFVSRPIANVDKLTASIGALNVILAYYKANDDVIDNKKGNFGKAFLKSSYKRAKKQQPKLDEIVRKYFNKLLEYENKNGDSIDISSGFFGDMLRYVVLEISGEKEESTLSNISYELGRWIYLLDALDDFDKDLKKKDYNVFINVYKDCSSKKELLEKYKQELDIIFGNILCEIENLSNNLNYNFNHDLLDNVFKRGLKEQTKNVMENIKCKNTTKF